MQRPPVEVHTPDVVFSSAHLPTWFGLAFAAGAVNAAAFLATQRFVSHVTGTVTTTGMRAATQLAAEALVVFLAFIVGAAVSVVPLEGRRQRGLSPRYHAPLMVEVMVLAGVALVGSVGVFGPFGATDTGASVVVLVLLAFAMGLQNATGASTTRGLVRTTHLTGTATDLGVNVGTVFLAKGDTRKGALKGAAFRAGKVVSFAGGAATMVPLSWWFGWFVFVVPAIIVALCAASSFEPFSQPAREVTGPRRPASSS
jgi:uncharacterized membrane protein YoaK (UPF0700 family)